MGRSNGETYQVERVTECCIILKWEDRFGEGSKQFSTLQELIDYLSSQQELARAVGVIKRRGS